MNERKGVRDSVPTGAEEQEMWDELSADDQDAVRTLTYVGYRWDEAVGMIWRLMDEDEPEWQVAFSPEEDGDR